MVFRGVCTLLLFCVLKRFGERPRLIPEVRGITPNPILGHPEPVFLFSLAHTFGKVFKKDKGVPEAGLGIKGFALSHPLSEGSPLFGGNIKESPLVGCGHVLRPEFAVVVKNGQVSASGGNTESRFFIKRDGLVNVARDAVALLIHEREVKLRDWQSVVRGTGIPSDRFGLVFRDSLSPFIHETEFAFPRGVPLLSRFSEPLDGFFRIPCDSPFPLFLQQPKPHLGFPASSLLAFPTP